MALQRKFNKKAFIISVAVLVAVIVILGTVFTTLYFIKEPMPEEGMRSVAYITAGNCNDEDITLLDFNKTTHVIYGFSYIDANTHLPFIREDDKAGLEKLSSHLRQNYPSVKFMLSIGGGEGGGFCEATNTYERREAFIKELDVLCNEYDFDGIDVDWEYPGFKYLPNNRYCSTCKSDHASLMEQMREYFKDAKILSIAMSGSITLMNDLKNLRLRKVLDFVNVMTYDLSPRNHSTYSDTASAMYNAYLAGYDKRQLNLGLPFYARYSKEPEYDFMEFDTIQDLIAQGKAKFVQKSNFSYAIYDGRRLSIDTELQIEKKVKLAVDRGYGGVFCWNIGCDFNGTLMDIVWKNLY